jgi:eukaryotic-like serine/threonine-protein kinase
MTSLSDATLERLRRTLAPPDLGSSRYELLELIGQGGMGSVYRAVDHELGREVAVKLLRDTTPDPRAVQRLLQEARVIAQLEHPGIVPVHDVGQLSDGRVYYVMKLVRGSRLDQTFRPSSPLDGRLRVLERVCEAVAFAHAHGIIHRDLKPQNVMVGDFGEVLVLDWGVAKLRRAESPGDAEDGTPGAVQNAEDTRTRQTADGTIIGTPAYMSPEQARGEVDRVDERSDVFALGAILHFLLAGTAPVTPSIFARQRNTPKAALIVAGRLPHSAPRALAAVCRKALAANPAERYASAGELAAEVARFRSGQRVAAHHEGPVEWVGRLGRKYRTPLLLVLAYLVMRILLAFWRPA